MGGQQAGLYSHSSAKGVEVVEGNTFFNDLFDDPVFPKYSVLCFLNTVHCVVVRMCALMRAHACMCVYCICAHPVFSCGRYTHITCLWVHRHRTHCTTAAVCSELSCYELSGKLRAPNRGPQPLYTELTVTLLYLMSGTKEKFAQHSMVQWNIN